MEEKLKELESDLKGEMKEINSSLAFIEKTLENLSKSVQRITVGLYGDEINDHIGVIERQKDLEHKIKELELRLDAHDKSKLEHTVAKSAKEEFGVTLMKWGKTIFRIVIEIIIIYLVIKGKLSMDALK